MTFKKITFYVLLMHSFLIFSGCKKTTNEHISKELNSSNSTENNSFQTTDSLTNLDYSTSMNSDGNELKIYPDDATTTTLDSGGNEVKTVRGFID